MQHKTPIVILAYWLHRNPLIGGNGCLWETNHSQGCTEACLSLHTLTTGLWFFGACLLSDVTSSAAAIWGKLGKIFRFLFKEGKKRNNGSASILHKGDWEIYSATACNGLTTLCGFWRGTEMVKPWHIRRQKPLMLLYLSLGREAKNWEMWLKGTRRGTHTDKPHQVQTGVGEGAEAVRNRKNRGDTTMGWGAEGGHMCPTACVSVWACVCVFVSLQRGIEWETCVSAQYHCPSCGIQLPSILHT